jgi:hypothetical protein
LDKQAWKILKVLYPESTTTGGECLQCRAEACQAQKQLADQQEAARLERKLPLQTVRRFYTRTRGVQEHYLRKNQATTIATTAVASTSKDSFFRSASHDIHSWSRTPMMIVMMMKIESYRRKCLLQKPTQKFR